MRRRCAPNSVHIQISLASLPQSCLHGLLLGGAWGSALEPVSIQSIRGIDQVPCDAGGSISIVQDLDLGRNGGVAILMNITREIHERRRTYAMYPPDRAVVLATTWK